MSILPFTTRSSPVTARICASTAFCTASRLRNHDVAIRLTSATPKNAATGIPRRFIPWAIVNAIIQLEVVGSLLKGGGHAPDPGLTHPRQPTQLDGFS